MDVRTPSGDLVGKIALHGPALGAQVVLFSKQDFSNAIAEMIASPVDPRFAGLAQMFAGKNFDDVINGLYGKIVGDIQSTYHELYSDANTDPVVIADSDVGPGILVTDQDPWLTTPFISLASQARLGVHSIREVARAMMPRILRQTSCFKSARQILEPWQLLGWRCPPMARPLHPYLRL